MVVRARGVAAQVIHRPLLPNSVVAAATMPATRKGILPRLAGDHREHDQAEQEKLTPNFGMTEFFHTGRAH